MPFEIGCDLVVLSACDTRRGVKAGGSVMALPWGFFYAGAPTVIASLWKVEDNATRALMVEFYKNLWEKKLGKLNSLCAAQRTLIELYDVEENRLRDPDDPPEHRLPPVYWAAFTLNGDWR